VIDSGELKLLHRRHYKFEALVEFATPVTTTPIYTHMHGETETGDGL